MQTKRTLHEIREKRNVSKNCEVLFNFLKFLQFLCFIVKGQVKLNTIDWPLLLRRVK